MRHVSDILRRLTLVVITIVILSAPPLGAQSHDGITWSPELHLKNLDAIPNRLSAPVLNASKQLRLTDGKASREVANCDQYLKAVSAGFHPATNYENKMSASFVYECFVLRDLQHARPAAASNSYHWTADSLTQLPPALVAGAHEITDAAEQAEKRGESWKEFNPALRITKIDGDLLLAEDPAYVYSLQILARADFNGHGVEDLAVYGTAQGKHSTWSHAEYFILAPIGNGKLARLPNT
jgi:hypothetical protein